MATRSAAIDLPEVMGDVTLLLLGRFDVDPHRVMLVAANDGLDLPADRGREEKQLSIGRRLVQKAADGRKESHVRHAVRFVQHDRRDVVQHHVAPFDQVLEPAWTGHDDVHALVEGANLVAVSGASKDRDDTLALAPEQRAQDGVHLGCQLARRHEDEGTRSPRSRLRHVGDNGHAESQGLARAGGCLAADVPAGQGCRDGG